MKTDDTARLRRAAARLNEIADAVAEGRAERDELDAVIAELVGAGIAYFGERPPAPRGEGARGRILAHLKARVGEPVRGEELRVVSGIGEWARRVRELRVEDGYDIRSVGRSTYVLVSPEPQAEVAARWRLANSIRREAGSARSRIEALLEASVGEVVTREQLDYVAKIKEGSRRVRELRDEHGWPINSHIDEPELSPGEYRLISADPADRRDPLQRLYPEGLREKVFARDRYTCAHCGRDRVRAEAAGDTRFYLEVHHKVAISDELAALPKAERNDASNLLTLCHTCHNEETEVLKKRKAVEREGRS